MNNKEYSDTMIQKVINNGQVITDWRDREREDRLRSQKAEPKFDIGVLWCTFFERWSPPTLQDAYRSPSLFASKMRDDGHPVQFLMCDEKLQVSDLDGKTRTLQDTVNLCYIMTHGEFKSGGYEVLLNEVNWTPGGTGLAQSEHSKLVVAVFDTCNLINTKKIKNWQSVWSKAKVGPSLRLLLGFNGPAVVGRGAAERGVAFAKNLLDGMTFVNAWIRAVHDNNPKHSQYINAVAIGIGDSPADAQSVLDSATLNKVPAARKGTQLFFIACTEWRI
jgi:Family of unknown function (DUF6345)